MLVQTRTCLNCDWIEYVPNEIPLPTGASEMLCPDCGDEGLVWITAPVDLRDYERDAS